MLFRNHAPQKEQLTAAKAQDAPPATNKKASFDMVHNPLLSIDEDDLRSLCRRQIDALEHWSRRLITDTFTESYGAEYWDAQVEGGQPLEKSEIRKRIESRMREDPGRYPRWIDAVLLNDIEYFLCRDDLYAKHFRRTFEPFYSGKAELGAVLDRLAGIRNKLSHGNAISVHEAEQALCYSGDIIDCLKNHYSSLGKARKYNVPYFTSAKDSLGNEYFREDPEYIWEISFLVKDSRPAYIELRSGDVYKIWVEVDGAFPESSYEVKWDARCGDRMERGSGNEAEIALRDGDVSTRLEVIFTLTTKNSWHKHAIEFDRSRDFDDRFRWKANDEILPPIESTY